MTARKILSDSGGNITLRRLNRREYANTLEDLLGIRPDVSLLPNDQANAKYDTLGASLFFSSDQLEQYLATARKTLELALVSRPMTESKTVRYEPEETYTPLYKQRAAELKDRRDRTLAWRAAGKDDEKAKAFGYLDGWQAERQLNSFHTGYPQVEKYLAAPENKTGAAFMLTIKNGFTRMELPSLHGWHDGRYTIRVRAAAYAEDPERFQYLEFSRRVGESNQRLGWRKVSGTLDQPQEVEFTVDHPAGMRARYYVHKRTHQDRGDKNLWTVYRKENGYGTPWGIWVDWVEMLGPEPLAEPNPLAKQVLFERPSDLPPPNYAREVIRRFAERAFRGEEPDPEFLSKLYDRFTASREKGGKQLEALLDPLSIILSSPSFLYMVESTGNDDSAVLTDAELAVRLSYFLWSAPPDAELLALAKAGELRKPDVLKAQTDRLLSDARADRFLRSFVHQWLHMDRLGMFAFSGRQFPIFDNATRESAREEIFQTITMVLKEKLPLRTMLKSDFVVVNDVLADYYELDGVEGHAFRKVTVPEGSPRGGLLGTAAVMAMGSDGLRSSPVERGAWVLRHLLNTPPPPAPPDVPQLSRLDGKVLSSRELQKAHQEEPQCAQCHRKIDPIGFGLDNFDAAGQWRDMEFVTSGKRKSKEASFKIDPSGSLANGKTFNNYFELRDVVAEEEEGFAHSFTEALISYGLGRPFGFTDHDLATKMVAQAQAHDYAMAEFIHALVQSIPFQTK